MEEIWKSVIGYEGYYEVSNLGNVKSVDRVIKYSNNKTYVYKGKLLKKTLHSINYYTVHLTINNKGGVFLVHKLVAGAFLSHNMTGNILVVNHKDFNKTNNNIENLEIVTNRENSNRKHLKHSSKYTGVSWYKPSKKWIVYIGINKKNKYLGLYENEYNAHLAYEKALAELLLKEAV